MIAKIISWSTHNRFFVWIGILLIPAMTSSQSNFIHTYGGANFENAAGIVAAKDGGYLICGYSASFDSSGASIYLLKVDSAGNHVFSKTYGGSAYDIPTGLAASFDGGYAISGITWSFGAGDADAFLLKTDSMGNFLWMKTLGTVTRDKPFGMVQTSDSGFAISGTVKYDPVSANIDEKIFLLKTDANGNLQWFKTYGGTANEESASIIQSYEGGFLIAGYTQSFGAGSNDCYVLKTDSTGNMLWAKTFGTSLAETGNAVVQTQDSGYAIIGTSEDCGFGNGDILLIRLNSDGDTLWSKCYGSSAFESASQIIQAGNENLMILGLSIHASNYDILLAEVDGQGNLLNSVKIGSGGEQSPSGLCAAQDASWIVAGQSNTDADPYNDLFVAKIEADGEAACFTEPLNMSVKPIALSITDGVQLFAKNFIEQSHIPSVFITNTTTKNFCSLNPTEEKKLDAIKVFPNPFTDFIMFKMRLHQESELQLRIYDVMSRMVIMENFKGTEILMDGRRLSAGIYFYSLKGEQEFSVKGIIVKH